MPVDFPMDDASRAGRDTALMPEIQKIRDTLAAQWQNSYTSAKFQDTLLQFIHDNSEMGGSVLEVGCYMGGLTAQLAWLCRELNKKFFTIDVGAEYIEIAKRNVDSLVPGSGTSWFLGDLAGFIKQHGETIPKPIVVFIDGDHRYPGVVKDIQATLDMKPLPYAMVFHDFGLRARVPEYAETAVDRAIYDTLGRHIRMQDIGETPLTNRPEDAFYFEPGLPEGVIILSSDIHR